MTAVVSLGQNRPGTRKSKPRNRRLAKARLVVESVLLAALLILLAGLVELREFSLPAPTGPQRVGTTTFELTDPSRHESHSADPARPYAPRRLVVQVWYPAGPSRNRRAPYQRWRETELSTFYNALIGTHARVDAPLAAPFAAPADAVQTDLPILLFSPRWGGERTQNTGLAEDLASHGYVVAAVDHPYNASRVVVDGHVIRGEEELDGPAGPNATAADRIAFWNRTLDVWAADESFALDALARRAADPADRFFGRLDTAHAGAFGHSFGGAAALRLCGLDPRIVAAVNLDGWTFGALDRRTAAQPVMILYEAQTADRREQLTHAPLPGTVQDQLDRADNAAVDASFARFGGERYFLRDTQHLDFSDQPLLPPLRRGQYTGPIAPKEVNAILRDTVRRFFDTHLLGRNEPVAEDNKKFPELVIDSTPSPTAPSPVGPRP